MRVGLSVIDTLEKEKLGARAAVLGEYMRKRLRASLSEFE